MESGTHNASTALRTVVVGVDGSPGAEAALRYAIEEARRQGATLRVVGVWFMPSSAYMGMSLPTNFAEDCERAARTSIDRSLESIGHPADVPLEVVIAEGQPAAVLVAQAATARVSSSARAGAAASASCCSARSARPAPTTRTARSSSCPIAPGGRAENPCPT